MKKTMRRTIALMMALSLCAGILVLPAAADEGAPQETTTTVTVEIRDSTGAVIGEQTTTTTTGETGTTISEHTSTSTEDENGVTTQVQSGAIVTTDPSGRVTGEGTYDSTTQVQSTTTGTGSSLTETDKTWQSTHTEYDPDTQTIIDENTDQKTESNSQTVVEGSSENKDNTEIIENGTHYFGSETGTETTVITDTSATTTTKTDQELSSRIDDPEVLNNYESYGKWSEEYILDSIGTWNRAPGEDIADPNGFEAISGSESRPVSTQKEEDLVDNPLENTDVKLEMKAPKGNGETYSPEKKVTIHLKDVIPPESDTVRHVYEDGVLVGYITYSNEKLSPDNKNNPIVPDETPKTDADYTLVSTDVDKIMPDKPIPSVPENDYTTIDTVITPLEDAPGYRVVETKVITTDYPGENLETLTGDQHDFVNSPEIPEDAIPYGSNSYIQLPGRAEESETTDPSGRTTKVTVEELRDENDTLIGYKTITEVTDEDGNLISKDSVNEYGSVTTFTSTTVRDPDTNQVTVVTERVIVGLKGIKTYTAETVGHKDINTTRLAEEDIYQMVNTEEGLVFLYQGKMYKVIDDSENVSRRDVMNKDSINVKSFIDGSGEGSRNDLRTSANYSDGYYTGGTKNYTVDSAWTLTGHGLFSDLQVKEVDGDTHTTKQFEIQKRKADGTTETRYVYCVEMGTNLSFSANYDYGSTEYQEGKDNAHPWKGATGTIGQLRSVALNGFWGTEEGLGSLQAVKDLMQRNGVKGWDELTPGMAITATQVAIWEFGAKTSGQFGGFDENGKAYWEPKNYEFVYMDGLTAGIADDKMKIVEDLRDLLVRLAYDEQEGKAEELDGSDVVGGAIILKDKISDGANDADTYNTDIAFSLDVSTSSLNGDLIVDVQVDGKSVGKARLAGNDDKPGLFSFGRIYPEKDKSGNYVYTIKDVELAAGVVVDLKLTGTQHLDDGVYIFGNSTWQDFIGLSTLERDVDLTISMEFEVEDPQIVHTEQSWKEIKTDKEGYVRTDQYHKEREGTETSSEVTVTTKLYGTTVQTDVTTTVTKVQHDWESYYDYVVMDINDQDVEPADPPKTGDTTLILAMVCLFSGGGYVLLNRKKEEE